MILDGGAFWNCRGAEVQAISDACGSFIRPNPGCEAAARAAVDQVHIDKAISENEGSRRLYEMNAAAVTERD